jgi:ParB family chromosome partitioning protein
MSKKASGLGRGLGALIPEAAQAAGVTRAGAAEIPLHQIKPNPYQPRRSFNESELAALAESIRSHGVLQPIVVEEGANGYTLIAGERRLRASKLAGRTTIPAVVRNVGDLAPIDTALAYRRLADEFGLTQDAIAVIAGKARATVANTMRLLDLSQEVQEEVIAGRLTEGHARALVGLPEAEQAWLARTFVRDAVTVRGAEAAASTIRDAARGKISEKNRGAKVAATTRGNGAPPSAEIAALQRELEAALGTPVKVKPNGPGGQILIDYYSNEELERLIDVMKGSA